MYRKQLACGILALFTLAPTSGNTKNLDFFIGETEWWARVSAATQAGIAWESSSGSENESKLDGSIRINGEWLTHDGWLYGIRLEYDSADHIAEELQRDELYLFAASEHGRFELGEQDGPADVMAFHAPVIGLGQVGGDFARYGGRQALLSAYDTSDALKAIYLSPPIAGLRYGISWAPERTINEHASDPRDRTLQNNAIELGVQYQQPFNGWIIGSSFSYVRADADPVTQRNDIDSWSAGIELRHKKLIIGAAYVDRGNSNMRNDNYNQHEINAGFSWRERDWGAAASASINSSSTRDVTNLGAGFNYYLKKWLIWRADFVSSKEQRRRSSRTNNVLLTEFELRY